ncbi:MAG: hypothetical protein JWN96_4583 [Mycobacterium sp.]|nr:hypothetical protein [Mycobacterium sp.]
MGVGLGVGDAEAESEGATGAEVPAAKGDPELLEQAASTTIDTPVNAAAHRFRTRAVTLTAPSRGRPAG